VALSSASGWRLSDVCERDHRELAENRHDRRDIPAAYVSCERVPAVAIRATPEREFSRGSGTVVDAARPLLAAGLAA
jgi:hypothetical protein